MEKKAHRKKKVGVVVSNKMDKTVSVMVERLVLHPVFKKYYKKRKKFLAHNAKGQLNIGDLVELVETKPISKRKRWAVRVVLKKAALEA